MTSGKRQRQQQKREKALAKAERRASRQTDNTAEVPVAIDATESQLIDELAALHQSLEAGDVGHEEFEARRESIRLQLEQIGGIAK